MPSIKTAYGEQKTLEDTWKVYRDAGMRTWQKRLLPEFRKVSNSETQDRLDEISFRIIKYGDFNAFSNHEKMEILIPVGLIQSLQNISDAISLIWIKPKCADKYENYLNKLLTYITKYK